MIDEDRTMQLFGYTSDELSKGSHKKIVAVCEECGIYRCVRKQKYRELCNPCSRPKGENSPHWKGGEVAKICEVCDKEFLVKPCQADSARFCSRECSARWQSTSGICQGKNNPSWKGGEVAKICEVCGKEFTVKVSVVKKGRGRFCSCECKGKWMSENLLGENNPRWKEKVVKICEVCDKEFSVFPSQSHHKFCSRECRGKWQSEARSGEPHPSGENSPLFNKPRSSEARKRISATKQDVSYCEWESFATDKPYCPKFNERCRESNREKYDRCCFLSGMTEEENGARLSVHHIDMDKTQGCDGHAWKLVPLCKKLHSTSHTPTWTARIIYLLNHVWNPGGNNVIS